MSRNRFVAAAAVTALLFTSAMPAIAGGWYDDDDHYAPVGYGYAATYGVASVPVVAYRLVPVPIVTQQQVLVVNQGPTFVPTTVNYISPTVTYEYPRVFPYGSSGYGHRRHGHHHHHRHHVQHRKWSHHGPRHHAPRYRDPGYK